MTFYLVDGSEDCFYTAVFSAFNDKDGVITSCRNVQLGFDSKIEEIKTDEEKAERVRRKLNALDPLSAEDISLVLKSCEGHKEQTCLDYIRLIIKNKGAVRSMLAVPTVLEISQIRSRVSGEAHKMTGFLRFMENADGVLYAPYSPDNDITDILARHFAERFKNQKFVIHDIKRKIAAMYDGATLIMVDADGADVYLSEYEKTFEDLWKLYYKSVNIESRPHEKQMKGYMPVRYWKFLPEKKE